MSTASTSLAALNLDVLDVVASLLSGQRDLIAFIETSRTLYDAGIRHLLYHVSLHSPKQVKAFNRFIRYKPHYASKLRRLSLDSERMAFKTWLYVTRMFTGDRDDKTKLSTRFVAEVIQVAPNLEWLDMNCTERAFRDGDSLFIDTLAKCKSLHILVLQDNDNDGGLSTATARALRACRAPLVELSLDHMGEIPLNILDVLSPFTTTLATLYMSGAAVIEAPTCTMSFPFPRLESLELTDCEVSTSVLEAAFPNLQCLHVGGRMRSRNEAHVCSSWKQLRSIEGNPAAIASLGLTGCNVEMLDIDQGWQMSERGPDTLRQLLRTLQPKVLRLSCTSMNLLPAVAESHPGLDNFIICLVSWSSHDVEGPKAHIVAELDTVPAVLPSFTALKHICVIINSGLTSPRVEVDEQQIGHANRWAHSCPTLQTMGLEWVAAGWNYQRYNRLPGLEQSPPRFVYSTDPYSDDEDGGDEEEY